jgi:HlyD family secretion protein
MTANVRVVTDSRDNVLKVPNAALRFRPAAGRLWVPGDGGKPAAVSVKIGLSDGSSTEILEGLKEGDEVVLGGGESMSAAPAKKAGPAGPRMF